MPGAAGARQWHTMTTMIQPAPVLPSNAPLRNDGGGFAVTAGYDQYGYLPSNRVKHEDSVAGTRVGGVYPTYPQLHPPPLHDYQQRWPYRPTNRYGFARSRYCWTKKQMDDYIAAQAGELADRFYRSDQYQKYRLKQAKDEKGNQEHKWPDAMEEAFFKALVRWPPMGRRKQLHKDKQRGRNELIADYIEQLTGEGRTRKQVSSHIQVLKPFVQDDPYIMQYLGLSKDEQTSHGSRRGAHASIYGAGMARSMQNPAALPTSTDNATASNSQRVCDEQSWRWKTAPGTIEPTDFSMFIHRVFPKESEHGGDVRGQDGSKACTRPSERLPERLHTYSRSPENARNPDVTVRDFEAMAKAYPLLEWIHNRCGNIDCNVMLAEASIALPTSDFAQYGKNRELGIVFSCSTTELPAGTQLKCITTFHKPKEKPLVYDKDDPIVSVNSDGSGLSFQLKFGSVFWAGTLGGLTSKANDPSSDPVKVREEISQKLQNLYASQELFAVVGQRDERRLGPRIAIIHWTFRQSSMSKGKATWSKLIIQSLSAQQRESAPKQERSDSFVDFNTMSAQDSSVSQQPAAQPVQPALQSPFEYDSGPASAVSSSTWPTTVSDSAYGTQTHQSIQTEYVAGAENNFDFGSGQMNIGYDVGSLALDNFDTAAFNFDPNTDFSADPDLEQYTQQWFESASAQPYSSAQVQTFHDAHSQPFDNTQTQQYNNSQHQAEDGGAQHPGFAAMQPISAHADHAYAGASQLDHSHGNAYGGYEQHYDPNLYDSAGGGEQQAYGGANQEGLHQDALTALADASFMASLAPRHE